MRNLFLVFILLFQFVNCHHLFAQSGDSIPQPKSKYWKFTGTGALQFNQISLSNWAAGGTNSISFVTNIGFGANYKHGNSRWENQLQYDYGILKNEDIPFRKNLDVLNLSTNYSYKLHKDFRVTAFTTVLSQFFPGYDYKNDPEGENYVSNFLAPAFIQQGLGFEYVRDSVFFSLIVSPLAVKHTLVMDDGVNPLDYGVESGRSRHEFGAFVKANIQRELVENVFLTSDITFFSNYLKNPQNIDIIYQGKLDIVANKFITVSLSLNLIYDDDVEIPVYKDTDGDGVDEKVGTKAGLQARQAFGAGLSYKF